MDVRQSPPTWPLNSKGLIHNAVLYFTACSESRGKTVLVIGAPILSP